MGQGFAKAVGGMTARRIAFLILMAFLLGGLVGSLTSCATVPGPCSEANEFRSDDCPCGVPGVYSCTLPGDGQ